MKKLTKKKKRVLLIVFIVILLIGICFGGVLLSRYTRYKSIMGTYELVDGQEDSPLVLGLYKWSRGKKEDLKCDLYNCSGYEEGSVYYVNDKVIQFRFDKYGYIEKPYKISTEGEDTFITFTVTSADGVISISKWKKVK